MDQRIDYTDRGVAQAYQDMTEQIVHCFEVFLQSMEEMCRKHSYAPMVQFVNDMQRFYQEELYRHVQHSYRTWEDSEYSLVALARRLNGGSGAENTGRNFMQQVENAFQTMFRRTMPVMGVDTSAPMLSSSDIEVIGEEINAFVKKADQQKSYVLSRVDSNSRENMLYACVRPIIVSTGESLIDSFSSMIKATAEGAGIFAGHTAAVLSAAQSAHHADIGDMSVGWPADVPYR